MSNEEKTTEQETKTPPELRNPTGKGGFGDHPENRNPGGWDKRNTFSYQMNRFKNMTVIEFNVWEDETSISERTMAEQLAYQRVKAALTKLDEFREVADRTEGKAIQPIDPNGDVEKLSNKQLSEQIREVLTEDDPVQQEDIADDTSTDTDEVQEG